MTLWWRRWFFLVMTAGFSLWPWGGGGYAQDPPSTPPPLPPPPEKPAWVSPQDAQAEGSKNPSIPAVRTLKEIVSQIAAWLEEPGLKGAEIGIAVSTETGQALYQHRAQELCIPASNTKLFTIAAALYFLGPHYRYQTKIYADNPIDSQGTLKGNLYIKGSGDPTLRSEELWRLSRDLFLLGLRKVTGRLFFDDSFFDEETFGEGWKDHDHHRDRPYVAGISALSLNYNTLTIAIAPSKEGKPAKITVDPQTPYLLKIINKTTTTGRKAPSIRFRFLPSKTRETLEVSGEFPLSSEPKLFWRRVSLPSWYTAFAFADFLRSQKIRLSPWPLRKGLPSKAVELLTLTSPGLSTILHAVGKQSSNFTAEQILKTISAEAQGGKGTWKDGLMRIQAYLQSLGVPPGYVMVNGSGLGRTNRFSPLHFLALLRAMRGKFVSEPEFLSVQALGGLDGTLQHRMKKTPAQGTFRAKTGTLDGVSSLSGYLQTKAGQVLLLSLCMNGKVSHNKSFRTLQDRIAILLASLPEKMP